MARVACGSARFEKNSRVVNRAEIGMIVVVTVGATVEIAAETAVVNGVVDRVVPMAVRVGILHREPTARQSLLLRMLRVDR
jgi:hypothetical protein